jgi:succinate dehydrogenase / fumarate reductase cytochrome b subunit
MKINRPLSPHLTIYKPQLTSILSIFHRISASFLVLTSIVTLIFYKLSPIYLTTYTFYWTTACTFVYLHWILFACANCVVIALFYHMANGFRHLLWDFGLFLELRQVYASGIIMLISVIILITLFFIQLYTL